MAGSTPETRDHKVSIRTARQLYYIRRIVSDDTPVHGMLSRSREKLSAASKKTRDGRRECETVESRCTRLRRRIDSIRKEVTVNARLAESNNRANARSYVRSRMRAVKQREVAGFPIGHRTGSGSYS